jgi:hypothetical protein
LSVCCASLSLAARIDETDGKLASGSVEVLDDDALLLAAELDELVDPELLVDVLWVVGSDPGVPSNCAA